MRNLSRFTGVEAFRDLTPMLTPAIAALAKAKTTATASTVNRLPDVILPALLQHVEARPAMFPSWVAPALRARLSDL